ncbi:AmmeMemoRadiSam system radical SAM enzyme [candidate division KSB3 bacterium]|uniref:AmmeMemoRadiSam system radical SAM enzyme n=1 Tax=candidate division KSB3 bacterium TaxID=2044937 RepID=A0A9D5JU72_9BACT|nr:AmmeMemoRadiSam system radical SAM enzyme [candidate division KSB3 bacterium]MBD3323756.1 AmmeMemoRadiSam system radical SAM enzyme [candidate division KSB3 bacterium]
MSHHLSRRKFLAVSSKGTLCLGLTASVFGAVQPGWAQDQASGAGLDHLEFQEPEEDALILKEARHYTPLEELRVQCNLCPWECEVADQERGTCGVRENRQGTYYTLVHSQPCAAHIDPIEKKPLYHYLPGSLAFSVATAGCNIECQFCQNWDIAQVRPEQVKTVYMPPEAVTQIARRYDCQTIAYTYSEPVIFYEYMYDSAAYARQAGIGNVMISNGFIQKDPLVELCQHLTGVKIDLKAFTESFYREVCRGELQPVLNTLETLRDLGIWYEIVVLIVPTLNDSKAELQAMARWIAQELGPEVPVHFSRFHPMYKIKNLPPTPVKTVEMARQIALDAGLQYVYVGNIPGHEGENTYCPNCGSIVIRRIGYRIVAANLDEQGRCTQCQHPIPGVWNAP